MNLLSLRCMREFFLQMALTGTHHLFVNLDRGSVMFQIIKYGSSLYNVNC